MIIVKYKMEKPKLLILNKAKKKIKSLLTRLENDGISSNDMLIVKQWINEDYNVKCYIITQNEIVKSFVLLHNCDYDQIGEFSDSEKKHTKSKIIDFIYTFSDYRRNNLAYKLLLHVKKYDETTAFCSSENSMELFEKADFKMIDINMPIPAHRYPH